MKKFNVSIITALCSLALSTTSFAQDEAMEKFVFGLKIGGNYSNVYDEQTDDFQANPKLGLAAGAFLSIPIGKYLGVQPEVLFSQKGFQQGTGLGSTLGSEFGLTRTTNHLDIPLMFSIKPAHFLSIMAGPYYSYLLSKSDQYTYKNYSTVEEQDFKNDDIRKNTVGFIAGADINFNHICISPRVGWDLVSNRGDGSSVTPRYKNAFYQVAFGYRFY